MNSQQLLDELIHFSNNVKSETVDTIKTGAANNELQKVAICFIATPNVIAAAHSWGADLLITHEPTFHNHFDNMIDCDVIKSKNQLIEATGMTIFRFHDHAHYAVPDIIVSGLINTLGWKGDYDGKWRLILKKAKTPRELANDIKTKTQAAHVRMAGAIDTPITKIDLYVGAPGNQPYLDQRDGDTELSICGEITEWCHAEYVRDAAELGFNRSLIVFGHVASERDGMKYLCQKIKTLHPELEIQYFECGESLI